MRVDIVDSFVIVFSSLESDTRNPNITTPPCAHRNIASSLTGLEVLYILRY